VVVSAFANRESYLTLANYGEGAVEMTTADPYMDMGNGRSVPAHKWTLGGRSLVILKRTT
jgi:hypothetical protein